ncbi:MAG TPA: hypothetical protein VKT50_03495 [Candidatus Acidoferrales bacterium]|nr:hypothetical protein [Candidatus Acidoferrales bacterium]
MSRRRSLFASAVSVLMLVVLLGCGTALPTMEQDKDVQQQKQATGAPSAAAGSDNAEIDLQCAAERIRKAPAPFHWSYKKEVIGLSAVDWEADITPDSIAGTSIDSSGTRSIHATRSDSTSWNTAVLTLTGPLPASLFALVNNSSATVRASAENMNGESTIKYVIDTSRDKPADASLIRSVLGANGSVKGSAWVTRTGCPVKFVLDVEQHNNDGTVQKEHYEANVTQP